MAMALDFWIFGNGRGLGAPYNAQTFYWLPYKVEGSNKRRGAFYTFTHGFGAQLHSRQWRHPNPGERRTIKGRVFKPFQSHRRWFRVEVSWCTNLPADIDEANGAIRQIKADLNDSMIT
ncbi:hypothetical protein [Oceaniradius stylonematis]|uniref:hypothetical protein n=1 Tax=Oceaniradius stylonematis TaxID=2184161 RepID=UPI00273EEC1A|nr:hypothetical protein [Oceaniradius stylonematis]